MALKRIELSDLVDFLDDTQSEYADFFRPMLGYEAALKLYDGIEDDVEPLLTELEDELGFEFPSDLIEFYLCTNGGEFADLELFPLTKDSSIENSIHRLNVINTDLKESIGLDRTTLLIGKYVTDDNYLTCVLKEGKVYSYQLWNATKQQVIMEFEYLIQLIALEISYATDPDSLMDL